MIPESFQTPACGEGLVNRIRSSKSESLTPIFSCLVLRVKLDLHSTRNLPADCSSGLRAKGIKPERDQRLLATDVGIALFGSSKGNILRMRDWQLIL